MACVVCALVVGGTVDASDSEWKGVTKSTRPISTKNNRIFWQGGNRVASPGSVVVIQKHQSSRGGDLPRTLGRSIRNGVSPVTAEKISASYLERRESPQLYACTEESGLMSGIDWGTKTAVDKGKYPIERIIDLHGCSEASACQTLTNSITESFEFGHRCLLVITGWGSKSAGQSCLRSSLHRWLQADTIVDMVLYYKQAIPAHGGKGAFYILLRTNNNKSTE
ncbi:MAG: Smr/MutS family protein [Anaplasma sp.]